MSEEYVDHKEIKGIENAVKTSGLIPKCYTLLKRETTILDEDHTLNIENISISATLHKNRLKSLKVYEKDNAFPFLHLEEINESPDKTIPRIGELGIFQYHSGEWETLIDKEWQSRNIGGQMTVAEFEKRFNPLIPKLKINEYEESPNNVPYLSRVLID